MVYSTPMEYAVSSEDGSCRFDDARERDATLDVLQYLRSTQTKYAPGDTLIAFTDQTMPADGTLPPNAEYKTSFFGNSLEMTDALDRFGRGLTTTYTELVKRTYYKASLIPQLIQVDSFTEPFKSAVLTLANTIAANTTTPAELRKEIMRFTFDWGNFVTDSCSQVSFLIR